MMGPPAFTVRGVLHRTAAILDRHGASLVVAAALLIALPELLAGLAGGAVVLTTGGASRAAVATTWELSASGGSSVPVFLAQLLFFGFVICTAFADMRGEPPNPRAALQAAAALFLPMLGLTLLSTLGLMLGYLMFFVPGVMLHCAWMVAVPALVAEPGGALAALGRSRRLTAGHRWRICGLALLFAVAIMLAVGLGLLLADLGTGAPASLVALLLRPVLSAVIVLAGSVGVTALYIELRLSEAGGGPA